MIRRFTLFLIFLMCSVLLWGSAGCRSQQQKDADLYAAAVTGDLAGARQALSEGATVDAVHKDGAAALWEAAGSGHPELVQFLLDQKANINHRTRYGETPVHAAALFIRPEVIEILLRNGADVTVRDKRGRTPLDRALSVGRLPSSRNNPRVAETIALLRKAEQQAKATASP